MEPRIPVRTARHRFPARKISSSNILVEDVNIARCIFRPVSVYSPHPSIVSVFSPDLVVVPDDIFFDYLSFKQLILRNTLKLFDLYVD